MSQTSELPEYLTRYVTEQDPTLYTPQDHAVWQYIMEKNTTFFKDNAHPVYLEGLKNTGIPLDRIPLVAEMDEALSKYGWGAIPVCGFIPPAIFLEYQSRKILPIAVNIRTVDHIEYTPSPDIVHEAAGHAPIIIDPEFAHYLSSYASLATQALMSSEDIALYEAIRILSDKKESPESTQKDIYLAEKQLNETIENITFISEGAQVARMNWWTAEFGLIGTMEDPKIYGAGLLSSIGESQSCLQSQIKKIPFSLECLEYSYDITEPQPQLFVTPDFATLTQELEVLKKQMAYSQGGLAAVKRARQYKTLVTLEFDNSFSVSGIITELKQTNESEWLVSLKGPFQFSSENKEIKLPSQMPKEAVILIKDETKKPKEHTTILHAELVKPFNTYSLVKNAQWVAEDGTVLSVVSEKDFLISNSRIIKSVYSGPSHKITYKDFQVGQISTAPMRTEPLSEGELKLMGYYEKALNKSLTEKEKLEASNEAAHKYPSEWLLHDRFRTQKTFS